MFALPLLDMLLSAMDTVTDKNISLQEPFITTDISLPMDIKCVSLLLFLSFN